MDNSGYSPQKTAAAATHSSMLVAVHLLPVTVACPALGGVCEVKRIALSRAGCSEVIVNTEQVEQAEQEKTIE